MTPIDEAALKAGISDSEIMEIAGRWFHTGENQHRADGYYYRSLGTPTNVRGSDLIAFARALLSSHHEDGGRAATDKKSLTVAPVALGGEKGEAVAWRFRWHPEGDWHLTEKEPRGGDGTTKQPLFAAPVGKARMLTDEEADHITGMHNTGRSQGDSECAEAIQRKFCEVNGITLEGGNRSRG